MRLFSFRTHVLLNFYTIRTPFAPDNQHDFRLISTAILVLINYNAQYTAHTILTLYYIVGNFRIPESFK